MTKKKYYLLLFFWLGISTSVSAQNISVTSFKLLENDLTANTTGTIEKDQNGEVAALIKVVTTEQGFVFDGGMTGIVKTKQEVGEVWVYVPHGIKKITIKHPQLGVLREYNIPIPIEKAKTYEMVLTTGKVETIVTRSANKQYVIFNVNPANAIVELDNMPLDVSGDGYAEKSMPYGTYSYRVSSANYHTEAGQVIVTAQGKSEVNVKLRPNFGWIDFKGANEYYGAHVYVDNEYIGQLPIKSGAIKSGTHQVKVMKSMYKPYEQQVIVTDNNLTSLTVQMVANFANVTFATDSESDIWIDGRQRGKGQSTISLEVGDYTVEVKRASHRTVSEVVTISDITARIIQLPSPTPIYGVLDITSTPSRATVYIDGEEVGQTPLIKNDVLIGTHRITFKKEGYEPSDKTLVVKENIDNRVTATLPVKVVKQTAYSSTNGVATASTSTETSVKNNSGEGVVRISSNPSGARIKVDGVAVGYTPLIKEMAKGEHWIYVEKNGQKNGIPMKVEKNKHKVHFDLPTHKVTKE